MILTSMKENKELRPRSTYIPRFFLFQIFILRQVLLAGFALMAPTKRDRAALVLRAASRV
jgi:hypothetical protein